MQLPGSVFSLRNNTPRLNTPCWASCALWTQSQPARISARHAFTRGSRVRYRSPTYAPFLKNLHAVDTNLLDWKLKVFLAGVPRTPVERVAGAVFRAATDPDPATSGCPWMLPDDGPVFLLQKEDLREGVYDMLNKRVRRTVR